MNFLKRLERANKIFWYKTLFRRWFRNAPALLPLDVMSMKRILLMRRDMIGDMVITTSLLRTLKEKNPHLELDVYASPQNAAILKHNPRVARIFSAPVPSVQLLSERKELRQRSYDAILCLSYTGSTKDGVLANLISRRAVKVSLYETRTADLYRMLFNALIDAGKADGAPQFPLYETLHRVAASLFGFEPETASLAQEIFFSDREETAVRRFIEEKRLKNIVIFNLSARKAFRKWGAENNRRFLVAAAEAHPDAQFVITSAPPDRAEAETLSAAVHQPNVTVTPQTFGLLETARLIASAVAVVSPDTAIVHIAATFRVPTVILCTPLSSSIEWTPLNPRHINIYTAGEEMISTLAPETVLAAFERLLKMYPPALSVTEIEKSDSITI